MTGAQYIVDSLIRKGVTDAFGIPGGVILQFIYAMDERKNELTPHLSYHEQAAGFAACGYAQSSGKLGVAYATRGPGFTNLISAIADAYYDSLPVLFITAHTSLCPPKGMRVMADQEIDTCVMVNNVTKRAVRIDDALTFSLLFEQLCELAMTGRKGPVFLDIAYSILIQEVPMGQGANQRAINTAEDVVNDASQDIVLSICEAKRPVILAGDGINQGGARDVFRRFVSKASIPVISSRFSHDIVGNSDLYYGYVGSHGTRTANFILSKADLIISFGNRLNFPVNSLSFRDIFSHARLIRCDIDENEFNRIIPNSVCYPINISVLLKVMVDGSGDYGNHEDWLRICNMLQKEMVEEDMNEPTKLIADILKQTPADWSVVNDVGNNEFWVSRASVYAKDNHRTFYSKSFGALGCGLGKAIGVFYSTRRPVLCFTGDQGLQLNIQELQAISQNHLPIKIVLINNHSSGMIKDREKILFNGKYIHTTLDTGYGTPDFKRIAELYGIESSYFLEIEVSEDLSLFPQLPKGCAVQNMVPFIDKELFNKLNQL